MNNKKIKKTRLKKLLLPTLNGTPPAPPAPTSQQQLNHQTNKSEDIIKKQQKIIEELMDRVGRLEGTASAMQGELPVIRIVNTLLSPQLDETHSCSRRSCMIVRSCFLRISDSTATIIYAKQD